MSSSENNPKKVFKIKRFQIGLNVFLQLVAWALLVVMANYLAFNHYLRRDLSRNAKYALSGTTVQLLHTLKKPVKVVVFFSPGVEIYNDVQGLLREFQYASRKKLEVETIDPYRNFTRARELQTKYKFGANENLVILDYDGHTKFVNASDMADYDRHGEMFGQPAVFTAFKGEEALTGALLALTEEKQKKICLLSGHSEPDLKSDTIGTFRTFLDRQNLKVASLNLMNIDAVPGEVKTLVILAPKYDFSEREMKLLKDYWNNNGRLLVAIDPAAPTPRFTAFIREQGVLADDNRIMRTIDLGSVTGVVKDVTGVYLDGNPITKRLKGVSSQFFGGTQSLTLDQASVKEANIHLQSLIEAAEGFWGETNYNAGEGTPVFFDPKKDKAAPLCIAASVEKGALNDARVQVDSSRMIVVANPDFVKNDVLTEANLDFALSSLNWLLDREELIGIAAKPVNAFTLNLSEAQISRIFVVVMLVIPGTAGLVGLLGWVKRRK